jgi:hypothetical protein
MTKKSELQTHFNKAIYDRGFVISKFFTQNAHGLCCHPKDDTGNIIGNAQFDCTWYELLIMTMKKEGIDVYFVQETWLKRNVFDKTINDYHVFWHNGETGNHNFHSVAVVISPHCHKGWKATGAWPPITTDAKGEFVRQFFSTNVKLASKDHTGKNVQGRKGEAQLNLTLALVYHPFTKTRDNYMYMWFLDTVNIRKAPKKSEVIMGTNINSNIGTSNDIHATNVRTNLGPHGLPWLNKKGKNLLHVYLAHWIRVKSTVPVLPPGWAIDPPTLASWILTCLTYLYAQHHCTSTSKIAAQLLTDWTVTTV